jgi:type IV pilus assembly protein PilA
MRHHALVLLTGLGLGCGGPGKDPQTSQNVEVKPVAGAPSSSTSSRRTASKEVLAAFPLEHPHVVLYADMDGLIKTKLFSELTTGVLMMAGSNILPAQRKCIDVALDAVREIAVGNEDKHVVAVVRFDPAAQEAVSDCAKGLAAEGEKSAPAPAGASQAWSLGDGDLAALAPGMIVAGPQAVVSKALAARSSGAALAGLGLGADEYLTFVADLPSENVRARGSLLASDQRFRIALDADLPDEEMAKKVDETVNAGGLEKRLPLAGEEGKLLARLMKASSLKRTGRKIEYAFDLQEGVEDQARDMGMMATLAIAGVRKYIANAKQAEAKNTIGHLAKDVAAWWETEDPKVPLAKKKLVSFPAVPKTVPKATKVLTTEADWKAWAPLRFSMGPPQYYQYEIKAAKDGESAEIIAHGDLNGDGKVSTFKLALKVRRPDNHLIIAPTIEESDPSE